MTFAAVACGGEEAEETPLPAAVEEEEEAAEPEEAEPEEAEEAEEAPAETSELPDLGTIQVGYLPILGFAHFMVADGMGYFADQGLDVELRSFRSGVDMIAPLSTGDLDVGGGSAGPSLYNAVDQDLDIKIVGPGSSQPEGYGAVPLIVRTELLESDEVSEVADLEGRPVAINAPRGVAEYLLAQALEEVGMTVDDVELVVLPFPEMPAALDNAAVDAATLAEPLASAAMRPGENDASPIAGMLVPGDEMTENPQVGLVYFGQRLLQPENREVGVRFLVALLQAIRDLQGDAWRSNDDIINAILEYTSVNTDSVLDQQQYHFERGYTDLAEPLSLDQLMDTTYMEEALDRVGQYEE
jgi:NitT/TauT family transport system substrate-binding protein